MGDDATTDIPDLIPARMLNEVVYCPRLYWLEHVAGEWEESGNTIYGRRVHARVDRPTAPLPGADAISERPVEARSVDVSSLEEGIIAKIDFVESNEGDVHPVDYKRGRAPDPERVPGGVWPADRVQVAAQVMALRSAGYACRSAFVYYAATKSRVEVFVGPVEEAEVRAAVVEARRLREEQVPPPPLVDSPKRPRCSLVGICLPDETNLLREEEAPERPIRKLIPADDERWPVYIQAVRATARKKDELLVVESPIEGHATTTARLSEISHLSVPGNVQLTAPLIQELCRREIGVSFFSSGGWYYGALGGVATINVHTRIAQFRVATDPEASLHLARAFVEAKVLNSRTLFRRNAEDRDGEVLGRLKDLARCAANATSLPALFGFEGTAARVYFGGFASLLCPRTGATSFDFEGRNRRPPKDPVNALLFLAYAFLLRDCRIALSSVGFDPTVGFLHQVRPGRPARLRSTPVHRGKVGPQRGADARPMRCSCLNSSGAFTSHPCGIESIAMVTAPLPSVSYAKSPEQEEFVQNFQGKLKGRYHLAFLVGVEYLGGAPLRAEIERELGNPTYNLEEMTPARDVIVIFDRAVRAGLSVERLGQLVFPTYQRKNPKAVEGKTIAEGFELLERAYREDTNYDGVSQAHEVEPGCVRLHRKGSPLPCAYFVGVLKGVLTVFGVDGVARETACQWDGAPGCCFEARWKA